MDRRELALVAVERTRMPMVVTDPRQPDNPMVLANRAFLNLTGYDADDVIGRNCRMFQGESTSPLHIAQIRTGMAEERDVDVELLNYRKDGSTFWNQLHISPIHDDHGRLLYFFASQVDVTEQRKLQALEETEQRLLREVDHRAMNALAIVEGIVRLSRSDDAALYAASVQRRVQAIAIAHTILARRGWSDIPLTQLILAQVEPYGGRRVELEGPEVPLAGQIVQPLALVFHELAANAAMHGALSQPNGTLRVEWSRPSDGELVRLSWREKGGPAPADERRPGFGTTMINAIISRQLRGSVRHEWASGGLNTHLTIPTRLAS